MSVMNIHHDCMTSYVLYFAVYCLMHLSHASCTTDPAKLVNLPCPVEIHKTHDHAVYYKAADVAQMLIVYEDDMALEEAEEKPPTGYPSYYHSGLTPPMRRVVERRFVVREQSNVAPPRNAVAQVEDEVLKLMEQMAKDDKAKRNKLPALTSATKTLEDIDEQVVDYEPWMDNFGQQPNGVEFDTDDALCTSHPEVWLPPDVVRSIKEASAQQKEAQEVKVAEKKSKKKKEAVVTKTTTTSAPSAPQKKGIASKKNTEMVDEVTQAASSMLAGDGLDIDLDGNWFEDLNFDVNDEFGLDDTTMD
jgi:transcription initiation factor TFIID subunit 7